MIPISVNSTNTVGLVDSYNPKEDFVGEFDPVLLKQWAELVVETFTGEDVVYLSVHKNPDPMNTTRVLSASIEHGDEIQVMVCGTDCDDVVKKGGI
jgi:hypothetical protein